MDKMIKRGIGGDLFERYENEFDSNNAYRVAANASVKNGIANAAVNYEKLRKNDFNFSIELKSGSITNQQSSGRCWIFAALNTFRYELMKKNDIEDFELSQNYLFFYDKLEKANYFLESVLKTLDEDVDGRVYSWISSMPLGDGGQWDMIVNLVNKYGICPKDAYPDSANSIASRGFTQVLTKMVREDGAKLRMAAKGGAREEELRKMKEDMLSEVYRVLVIALGKPPVKFDFVAYTKDKKLIQEFDITPKAFFDKYVGIDINDYVSLINAPTDDKPYGKMYTVKLLGNVVEGQPVRYLNLPMDTIKDAVIEQLKDGHPVWFGSDCGQGSDRDSGIFDPETVDIAGMCGVKHWFTKKENLEYYESAMNHAMVILGVNLDKDGIPDKWKIENSWGDKAGKNGYYTGSAKWFDDYVYQVVVNKKYLDSETVKLLDGELNELEPWDPMGTLAD